MVSHALKKVVPVCCGDCFVQMSTCSEHLLLYAPELSINLLSSRATCLQILENNCRVETQALPASFCICRLVCHFLNRIHDSWDLLKASWKMVIQAKICLFHGCRCYGGGGDPQSLACLLELPL